MEERQATIELAPWRFHLLQVRRILLMVAVFGLASITALSLLAVNCSVIRDQHESATMDWCTGLVNALDSYHAAHGAFPEHMEDVADLSDAPVLVRDGSLHYSRISGGYGLDLWDGLDSGMRWDSQSRKWLHYQ